MESLCETVPSVKRCLYVTLSHIVTALLIKCHHIYSFAIKKNCDLESKKNHGKKREKGRIFDATLLFLSNEWGVEQKWTQNDGGEGREMD